MKDLYDIASVSKQSFHQMLNRRDRKQEESGQILMLVDQVRYDHPCMSVREIYSKLNPEGMGRDKFEQYCFAHGYRVKRRKNFRTTTDSRGVIRFPNQIKDMKVTDVNQVLVSDITYYEIQSQFYYITLIMDLFNREIVGYSASKNLRTKATTLPALKMAANYCGRLALEGAIIHSDGGGQYYSKEFKALTADLRMINSMTEESVYENAHAERLNGTIKNDYLYAYAPESFEALQKELKRAVFMYNTGKPHKALKKKTPVQYRYASLIDAGITKLQTKIDLPKATKKKQQNPNSRIEITTKK